MHFLKLYGEQEEKIKKELLEAARQMHNEKASLFKNLIMKKQH